MKTTHIVFALFFAAATLTSAGCSSREWVKPDNNGMVSFSFYIFMQIDGEKHSANGDAVLIRNSLFKFRIYDNIAGQYLMGFVSHTNGLNEMILPLDKTVVKKNDPELSRVLTGFLYLFFTSSDGSEFINEKIVDFSIESNKIKSVSIPYGNSNLKLEVLKVTPEGYPTRLRIVGGKNWMVFDILEYRMADFVLETEDYREYWAESPKPFIEWIGDVYGGG
ncbi:MAG: hypothetical protein HPY53_16695 [Brevinematales bacterium]|nr:hypothetical protein [Brevinematales bacterium]